MIQEKDVQVPVRDGVKIGVRIYRPEGSGPFPALFAASPYRYDNNELPPRPMFLWRETGPIEWYVEQGYAYVHADVRGTGISGGEFGFLSRAEQQDLHDVIEWIARQKWSNGKVGGIGQSYYCMSQWFMGIQNPPHLACLAPYDGMNDPYRYLAFRGGIESNFPLYWFNASVRVPNLYPANGDHPRILEKDFYLDVQRHPNYDDYWRERAAAENLEKIKVPVFSIGVWAKMELHLAGNILGYHKVQGPKKLFITGTASAVSSQVDFNNVEFHKKHLLPFYDKHLKGGKTSYDDRPNVEYIVKNTGVARSFDSWPAPGARRRRRRTAGPGSRSGSAHVYQHAARRGHGNRRPRQGDPARLFDAQRHGLPRQALRAVSSGAPGTRKRSAAALRDRDQRLAARLAWPGPRSGAQHRGRLSLHPRQPETARA